MKHLYKHIYRTTSYTSSIIAILILLGLCFPSELFASPSLKARLDSTNMLMGTLNILHLELEKESNTPGEFIQLKKTSPESGLVSLLGDTIELKINNAVSDTISSGNTQKINIAIPIQVFDSGTYILPPFEYVSGIDTLKSNSLSLKVSPVKVTAEAEISADAPPQEIPCNWWQRFVDRLPDFIYYYWWLLILTIALIIAALIIWRKYKKTGVILKKKPLPSPYEAAIKALTELKNAKLWENGEEKLYFTRLTEILRSYLEGRFKINAMEMTSAQIIETLNSQEDTKENKNYVQQILNTADFVKFARMRPLPDDNIEAFTNALKFVEETKPSVTSVETTNLDKKEN